MIIFSALHRACNPFYDIFEFCTGLPNSPAFQVVKKDFFKRQYNCLCQIFALIPILQALPKYHSSKITLNWKKIGYPLVFFFDTEKKFCIKISQTQMLCFKRKNVNLGYMVIIFISILFLYWVIICNMSWNIIKDYLTTHNLVKYIQSINEQVLSFLKWSVDSNEKLSPKVFNQIQILNRKINNIAFYYQKVIEWFW